MQGRVVLITGGTGALGSAVAQSTLEAGATAVVTYRDARDLDALKGRVPAAARDRLHGAQADVTDGVSVGQLVAEVTARHGRLDVLVNAVGGFAGGDLLGTDERGWDGMLSLNLRSVYLCCRAALPAMLGAGRGRIVNVASRSVVPPTGGLHRLHGRQERRDRPDPGAGPGGAGARRHGERRPPQHDGHGGEPPRDAGIGPEGLGAAGVGGARDPLPGE